MPRKGENIYKRNDGRWEGRYIKAYDSNGKARYGYIYAHTYSEVKIKLNNAKSLSQTAVNEPSAQFLLYQVAEKWLQQVRYNCKPSTYNKYLNAYRKHVKDYLGKYPMAKISGEMIDSFVLSLLAPTGSKPLSRKTAQDICMIVKQIYSYAEENYDIHPQFSFKKLHVKGNPPQIQTISDDEVIILKNYLLDQTDNKKLGVLLCLYTGIRIGELCALRWSDISLSEGIIKINKTVQRLQCFDSSIQKTFLLTAPPKSDSSNRIIPIPKDLKKVLFSARNEADSFFLSGSSHCVEPRTMENAFKKYLVTCGLPPVKFHVLRHTFATRCVAVGIDPKTLSEILGHSSVNITLNRYVHSNLDMKRVAMDKLSI